MATSSAEPAAVESDAVHAADGYRQPVVDVGALTALLDGQLRRGARRWSATTSPSTRRSSLDAEEMGTRRLPRARRGRRRRDGGAPARPGMGFPDGVRRWRRHRRLGRRLRDPRLRRPVACWSRSASSSASSAARSSSSARSPTTTPTSPTSSPARMMGCFAMTETGHGSNVQALGTTATYDAATQEFVITTPDDASRKDYIGNAAAHAELAVVFAQLEVDGERHGRARLRRADPLGRGRSCDGVRIEDCGRKMGLNGVDNGRIWFDGVRVPRTGLLNQFAEVTPRAGDYVSPIENPNKRFFTMLGTLVQGRVCVGGAGINAAKVALTIATSYAARRRQFEAADARRGAAAPRLRHAPAPAVPADRADLRAPLRAGGRRRLSCTTSSPASPSDEEARRDARVARGRHQGARHLARHADDPGVPRGVRWRGLPQREPVHRAEGRHRRLHDLRGRQPRAAAAGRQGTAHRLLRASSRTWTSSAWSGSSPASPSRPCVERTSGPQARSSRIKDLLPGGDQWDQEAGLLDPNYQLRDAALPRGAHARRGRPAAQARHRQRDEPGRGLLPGPGPRHRRGPRPRRAAGARRVRRQDRARCPTATTRSPSTCSATCTPSPRSRPTARGSWSTAGSPAPAPRRSAARSTACAARSGRWRSTSSTPSACPRRCCAAQEILAWRACVRRPRRRARPGARHRPALRRHRARGRAGRADRGAHGAARRAPRAERRHRRGLPVPTSPIRSGDGADRGRDRATRAHRRTPLQPECVARGRRPAPHRRPARSRTSRSGSRRCAGRAGGGRRDAGARACWSTGSVAADKPNAGGAQPRDPEGGRPQPRHQPRRDARRTRHPRRGGRRSTGRWPRRGVRTAGACPAALHAATSATGQRVDRAFASRT